jgi:hypothetical protein
MDLKDRLSLRSENSISSVLDCQPHQSDGLGGFCHRYRPFSSINWRYAILTVIIEIISILNLDKHLSESCRFPDVIVQEKLSLWVGNQVRGQSLSHKKRCILCWIKRQLRIKVKLHGEQQQRWCDSAITRLMSSFARLWYTRIRWKCLCQCIPLTIGSQRQIRSITNDSDVLSTLLLTTV